MPFPAGAVPGIDVWHYQAHVGLQLGPHFGFDLVGSAVRGGFAVDDAWRIPVRDDNRKDASYVSATEPGKIHSRPELPLRNRGERPG